MDNENVGNITVFNHYKKWVGFLLVLMIGFGIGFEKGKQSQEKSFKQSFLSDRSVVESKKGETDVDFSLFWRVWDLLGEKYVDSNNLDAKKMLYGSINGMLNATGDPYTTFFDPEENKKFNEEIGGSFEGIGAELGVKNGILTVIAPLEESPAQKAGLRSGDKIIKVDGKMTSDMTLEEAVNNIRGNKGTQVTLAVFREGEQDTVDIIVERNVINVKSVKLEFRKNNIAYIKINLFGEDTTSEFSSAIKKAIDQKVRGLVIDLRNNPGGYLESAIDIASKMLSKGNVVVIEENSAMVQNKIYAKGGDVASGIKTVVLINEGSASASEILSGALKENRKNVTLVGKKSFGKGSVQELTNLNQDTAVKITIAKWLTPNGEQINEKGIAPDIEVGLTEDDYNNNRDPQLEKALEILEDK